MRATFRSLFRNSSFFTALAIVGWYALPPPQLAGYAPVVYILHPVAVSIYVLIGYQFYCTIQNIIKRRFRYFIHFQKPLHGKLRLNNCIGALRITKLVFYVFNFYNLPYFFKVGSYFFPNLKPVFPNVELSFFAHSTIGVQNINYFKFVFNAKVIVIYIMGRGYL